MKSPKLSNAVPGAANGISLMTEDQLGRLARRLALLTKTPETLAAYATAGDAGHTSGTIGAVVSFLLPNKYRWALILGVTANGPAFITINNSQKTTTDGIAILSGNQPTILTYRDIGAAVLGEFFVFTSAAGLVLSWQEIQVPSPLDGSIPFSL